MHLAELEIRNFRRLANVSFRFRPGLNVLVGPNNVGKSAVVDALRSLLAGHEEPFPRFSVDDRHRPAGGNPAGDIEFHYVFRGLSPDDEADFLAALKPSADGGMEAHIHVRYSDLDKTGFFRAKRWCGEHEDVPLTMDMLENLRGVYLKPLRDASQSLRPSRSSQLSRLLHLLADDPGREGINEALLRLDNELKTHPPIIGTQAAIVTRHLSMLGEELSQDLSIGLSATDFQRLSSRLSLSVDDFDIEQNGLGFNNLIFMAVVLSELAKNPEASYRGLIVEEPEAHLHPQLQAILLRYLDSLQAVAGEKPIQLFVTSHSPNFASIANLDALACLIEAGDGVNTFFPREVAWGSGKREKLERYLDVTRAELFFARRVIFVEGAAELMLIDSLAKKAGFDLRASGVSLISVEGLNFDSFLPLFGEGAIKIPVAVITDADPQVDGDEDGEEEVVGVYPDIGENTVVSPTTAGMKALEDAYIKVFHGQKTLEYDFALYGSNREAMLQSLQEMHPRRAVTLRAAMDGANSNVDKACTIFCGMFERKKNNVKKGRFAQVLAERIDDGADFEVPPHLIAAFEHVCRGRE